MQKIKIENNKTWWIVFSCWVIATFAKRQGRDEACYVPFVLIQYGVYCIALLQ